MIAIIGTILAVLLIVVAFYKLGYSAAKKNILIHIFKEKIITPEQFKELENEDI